MTHYIKAGCGYWDITTCPMGRCFRRAAVDMPFTPEGTMFQVAGRAPHCVGRTPDGQRIAVREDSFSVAE